MRFFFKLVLSLWMIQSVGCQDNSIQYNYIENGIASYYANSLEGRLTSNGDIFTQNELTAAHRFLPFGTRVQVINLTNGKSVNVVINDRGPFVNGRIIDLSSSAADSLQMKQEGIVRVRIKTNLDNEDTLKRIKNLRDDFHKVTH